MTKLEPADLWSLDALLGSWPATPSQRRRWREGAQAAGTLLQSQGYWALPAVTPGLVQARVAAALLAAGVTRSSIRGQKILTLGAHVGLEVRILRDWGAEAQGIEQNRMVVEAGVQSQLVTPSDMVVGDVRTVLERDTGRFNHIIALAPSDPEWPSWIAPALERLTSDGSVVIVAYWRDVPLVFHAAMEDGLEGTMGVGVWRCGSQLKSAIPQHEAELRAVRRGGNQSAEGSP